MSRSRVLVALWILAACGGDDGGGGGNDAGTMPGMDAGTMPGMDAGFPADAGSPPGDASPTDYTIEAFDYEDPRPAEFHPLAEPVTALLRIEEVATVVPTASSGGLVLDDPRAGGTLGELPQDPRGSTRRIYARLAANLDGDGNDELVLAQLEDGTGYLRIRIVDSAPMMPFFREVALDEDMALDDVDVAAADVDGDGIDELIVAVADDVNVGWVRIFDDLDHDLTMLAHISDVSAGVRAVSVATSDLDEDGEPEFVTSLSWQTTTGVLVLFEDDYASGLGGLPGRSTLIPGDFGDSSLVFDRAVVHGGNFDDDPAEEVLLVAHALEGSYYGLRYYLIDDASTDLAVAANLDMGALSGSFSGYTPVGNRWPWRSTVADLNGDGTLELMAVMRTDNSPDFDWDISHLPMPAEQDAWRENPSTLVVGTNGRSLADLTTVRDKVGADDEIDEFADAVVASARDGDSLTQLRVHAEVVDAAADPIVYRIVPQPPTTRTVPSNNRPPWVIAGDFDADSVLLRYTGNKTLALADPMPIAILAAPPTVAGIDQRFDLSNTGYGTAVSAGSSETHEVAVTTRVTFTTNVRIPKIGLDIVESERNMDRVLSSSGVTTERITYGTSFRGSSDTNTIVFQGTLYHSYEYEIVGALDPTEIGQQVRIDVPVATRVYKWTIPFFNEVMNDRGWEIDATLLPHTIGDPSTYRTPAERDAILAENDGWKSLRATVGQGNGSVEVTIDLETESTTTTQRRRGNQTTLRGPLNNLLCTLGEANCRTYGFASTDGYSLSAGSSTSYAGRVGDIVDSATWADAQYDFGLFVYWHQLDEQTAVQVIDYWTE